MKSKVRNGVLGMEKENKGREVLGQEGKEEGGIKEGKQRGKKGKGRERILPVTTRLVGR